MHVVEEHRSPDGLLTLMVWRDPDGDITVGFDGFSWHTHADILAGMSDLPEDAALREFVDDTLNGRSIIAVARVGRTIRDVWITDTAEADKHKPEDETIEFRYWDGSLVV